MFIRAYKAVRDRFDALKEARAQGRVSELFYLVRYVFFRTVMELLVLPHFLLLGPFKTFTTFARKDNQGSWIDSYNDFIIQNKISVTGVIALILIALIAILVFVYLPIIYI